MWWLLLAGCARLDGAACACPMPGHGALDAEGRCLCLPAGPSDPEPAPTTTLDVSPDAPPDWAAIDAALADGTVLVRFSPVRWPEGLVVTRADRGPHRLILDGGAAGARAVVPGLRTGFGQARADRVTVRGFELTGSEDKGLFWNAGDDVILDDLVVHDNRGTPAIALEYSSRSGHASTGFTLRNSHVFNQPGECVYIGGSGGVDEPSHARVVIERNLIHDCRHPLSTQTDGINVKDRIGEVVVRENVVFHTDWGLEVASPGVYAGNLVLRTERNGVHVSDFFSPLDGLRFADNVVIEPGANGLQLYAQRAPAGALSVDGAVVLGAREAGVLVGGTEPIEVALADVVVVGSAVGFDGWGTAAATLQGCGVAANGVDDDRNLDGLAAGCAQVELPDWSRPAGPDDVFLTADDPGRALLR